MNLKKTVSISDNSNNNSYDYHYSNSRSTKENPILKNLRGYIISEHL